MAPIRCVITFCPSSLLLRMGTSRKPFQNYRFDEALGAVWQGISFLDGYINKEKPWEKEGAARDKDLQLIISHLLPLTDYLSPLLPETAQKIKKQFQGKITPAQPL